MSVRTGIRTAEPVREEAVYRYSVKADRITKGRIERAARTAGLSVEAFVQRHFDTILDQPAAPPAPFDMRSFVPAVFADRHGLAMFDAHVWARLRLHADTSGISRRRIGDIAAELDAADRSVRLALNRLERAGLARQITAAGPGGSAFHLGVMA